MYLAKPAASRLWANITFDNITSPVTKTVHVLNGTTKQSKDLLEILCNILKKSTRKEKQSNKINRITYRSIDQNKATELQLYYLYKPGKMPSYGIQTKYSSPKQSKFLLRPIPSHKTEFIGEMKTKITFPFSSLGTSFLLRTSRVAKFFAIFCCVLIGQNANSLPVSPLRTRVLTTTDKEGNMGQ